MFVWSCFRVSMLNFQGVKCFLELSMNKDLIKQILMSGGSCFFGGWGLVAWQL